MELWDLHVGAVVNILGRRFELRKVLLFSPEKPGCWGTSRCYYQIACLAPELLQLGGLQADLATQLWLDHQAASILKHKLIIEDELRKFCYLSTAKVATFYASVI